MPGPNVELRLTARDQTRAGIQSVRAGLTSLNAQIATLRTAGLRLGLAFAGLGLAVAPLVRLGNTAIDAADELKALSERTGVSVEKLSVLATVAKQANTDIGAVANGARLLSVRMLEAAQGSEKSARLLAAFGVEAGDSLEDSLEKILVKLGQLPDGWQKSAIAVKLFGRAGTALIPFANSLEEGLEQARRFNLVVGTETARAADAFNDGIELIKASLGTGFLRGVTPALQELADTFEDPAFQRGLQDLARSVGAAAGTIVANFGAIKTGVEALGGVFIAVFAGRMVGALKTYLAATLAAIQAENARRALHLASLTAAVQAAAAEEARTVAMLNSARAAAVAAAAQARMNLVLGTVIPLERAAAASATAHAAAQVGLAGAMGRTAAAGGLVRGVLGFLGGPIGAITTLLTLGATAWAIWGNTAQASVNQASAALGKVNSLVGQFSDSLRLAKAGGSQIAAGLAEAEQEAGRLNTKLGILTKFYAEVVGARPTGLVEKAQQAGRASRLGEEIKQTQAEVAALEESTKKLRALQEQGAEPTFQLPAGLLAPEPKKAKGGGAGAALNDAKALIDASLAATQDALDREQRNLDQALEEELVSFRDFYARRTAIALAGIDAEIAAKREALAAAKDQGDVARLTSEITVLERKRGDVAIQARRDQIAAERELVDELAEVRARVLEAEGKTAEASRIRLEGEFRELTARLQIEGDVAGVALVKRLFNIEAARAELGQLQTEFDRVREQLTREETRVNVQVDTGLQGELAGRREIVSLHTETAAKLAPIVDQMRLIAETIGPEEISRVAGLASEIEVLGTVTNEVAQSLNNEFKAAAASAFTDFLRGTKTAKEAFADFGNAILDSIAQIAAQNIAESLFGNLFGGAKKGGSAAGGGDTLGDLLSLFTSLAGLFHQGGIVGSPGPGRRVPALAFAGAPRLHDGGALGLRSNEVPAILQRGEEVLTRGDPRHRANRGAGDVTVVMNITTPDVQGFRRSSGQIAVEASTAIGRAARNRP